LGRTLLIGFIKNIVVSEDLPLYISRETLQKNLDGNKRAIVKKYLEMFAVLQSKHSIVQELRKKAEQDQGDKTVKDLI